MSVCKYLEQLASPKQSSPSSLQLNDDRVSWCVREADNQSHASHPEGRNAGS
jgi:hypothetical protein